MNSPVSSLKAISTPRSPGCFGSFIASLLVPSITTPSATVGLPYDCDPSSATHFTFFPDLTSHVVGRPFSGDTMLRDGVPPHIGQSADSAVTEATMSNTTELRYFIASSICLDTPRCYRSTDPRCRRRTDLGFLHDVRSCPSSR